MRLPSPLARRWIPLVAVAAITVACGGDSADDAIPPRITNPTVVPNPDFDPVDDPLIGSAAGGGAGTVDDGSTMQAALDAIAAQYPTEAAAAGDTALIAAIEEGCAALTAAAGAWEQAAAGVVNSVIERGVPVGFGAYVVGAGATLHCPENEPVVPFLRTAAEAAIASQSPSE